MSNKMEVGIICGTNRKIDFEWKIANFFSYTEKDSRVYSPEFCVLNSRWQIQMCPNGETDSNSTGYISLYLMRVEGKSPGTVDFSFTIKTADNPANMRQTSYEFLNNKGFGFPKFVERCEDMESLVPLGNLTILCSVTVKSAEDFDPRLNKLAENLTELYNSKKNSDVSLQIDDETILVHKSILSARSPVFCAMFENDMTEKKTGVINISDCDLKAFKVFLHYLYSGKAEFKECDIFELYKIVDKYDVPELKLMCIDFMIRSLSVENICDTFVFSHAFKEKKLQSFIQQFFCENFQNIVSSDSWKSLLEVSQELANDLLIKMAPKIKIVR